MTERAAGSHVETECCRENPEVRCDQPSAGRGSGQRHLLEPTGNGSSLLSAFFRSVGLSSRQERGSKPPEEQQYTETRSDREMEFEKAWTAREKHVEEAWKLREMELRHLSNEKLSLQKTNTRLSQDLKRYADEITRLRYQVEDLTANRESLQDHVRIAQEAIFRSAGKKNCAPKEDKKIREEFTKLEESLKSWVRKYIVTEASTFEQAPTAERDTIVRQLKGYCVQGNWHDVVQRMPSVSQRRIPLLFAQAMLAKDIFEKMFSSPFLAFAEHEMGPTLPSPGDMTHLYEVMMQVDEAEAHIWRSQMLRILTGSPVDSATEPLLSPLIHKLGLRLCKDFVNGPVQSLFRQDADCQKRDLELQEVYRVSGELALSLWTQRTYMECHRLKSFQIFNKDEPGMTAHRLHRLDEDDSRLDGKEIVAVIQPAVYARGNEDAENYDKPKVWAKAVVLVDDSA